MITRLAFAVGTLLLFANCAGPLDSVRSNERPLVLSTQEKLHDFDTAVQQFRNYYAPLKFKEERFGIRFEDKFTELRKEAEASKTDLQFYGVLAKLAEIFKDGHVSVSIPGITNYALPFQLDYFDGQYIIIEVDEEFAKSTGVQKGDEVLKIDGVAIGEVARNRLQYAAFGYERADKRLGAFYAARQRYETPASLQSFVDIKRKKDGTTFNVAALWKVTTKKYGVEFPKDGLAATLGDVGVPAMGASTPFFITPEAKAKFKFVKVGIDPEDLEIEDEKNKEKIKEAATEAAKEIFATAYRYGGKTILLIRIPSYSTKSDKGSVAAYQAILKKYEELADVLVIDQTHNPGGSVAYVEGLAQLFMKTPGPSFAFAPRADRWWLRELQKWTEELKPDAPEAEKTQLATYYTLLEQAIERGEFLGPPMSLTRSSTTMVEKTAWSKPILVLIDELCGSGGDGFPMIMKGNKAAKLFGHRTAGMGGNVVKAPALPYSGAEFRLTRSLFYLATADGKLAKEVVIENNGVTPDIERNYGLKDFNEGFTTYIEDFSKAAVELAK